MEFSLLGAAALGAVGVWAALRWEARRANAADCSKDLWEIAIGAMLAGVAVGRLAAMVGDGVNPLTNPGDVIIVRAGVATGPAALGALAWVAWTGRRELQAVADGLAVATLAGLGGWHAGCLFRDACLGTVSDLPWAIAGTGSPVSRHPVELYAAALLLLGAAGLAIHRSRRLTAWLPAGAALFAAGAVRWVTEPLRPSLGSAVTAWYAAATVAGLTIMSVALVRRRRTAAA